MSGIHTRIHCTDFVVADSYTAASGSCTAVIGTDTAAVVASMHSGRSDTVGEESSAAGVVSGEMLVKAPRANLSKMSRTNRYGSGRQF